MLRITRWALKVLLIGASLNCGIFAQSASTASRFEVASVRSSLSQQEWRHQLIATPGPKAAPGAIKISGSHLDIEGITMKGLISRAYAIDARLIVGPNWVMDGEATFAIHAVMPTGTTRDKVPAMLKTLLDERFGFVAHFVTVDQMAYSIVIGKNGSKLRAPRDIDPSGCTQWEDGLGPVGSASLCRISKVVGDQTVSTRIYKESAWGPTLSTVAGQEWHDEFYRITIPKLAEYLSNQLAPSVGLGGAIGPTTPIVKVLDRTGIAGDWDILIDTIHGDGELVSSISRSLEKQGLRLERATAPTEQLVVDRLFKEPSEN